MQPSEDDELIEKGSWMSSQAEDEWYRQHPEQDKIRKADYNKKVRYLAEEDKTFIERNFEPINRRELKVDYDPRSDEDRDDT